MKNVNSKNLFVRVWEYIFMIFTVLQCNSVYNYSPRFLLSKGSINIFWQLILIVLIGVLVSKNGEREYHNVIAFVTIYMLFMICFFICDYFIYPSFNKSYIFKFLVDPVLLIILFCSYKKIDDVNNLFIKFENLVICLSYISLIFWVLFIFGFPTNSIISLTKWTGAGANDIPGYFGIDFFPEMHSQFLGINWPRNSGLFVEPSIFAYVLLIAILIELFIRRSNKKFNHRLCILLITIISTASTTGILLAFPAIIYYVLILSKKFNLPKLLFISLLPVILLFLKLIFVNKTGSINTNLGSSSAIRSDDIMAGLKTWIQHPLLGCGLGNDSVIRSNMSVWRFSNYNSTPGESSGLPTMLGQGGIIIGLFYLFPAFLVSKISHKDLGLAIFVSIPFIFVVSQGFYIYIMLLSYFWIFIIANSFATNND